jgi:hypothetical protein
MLGQPGLGVCPTRTSIAVTPAARAISRADPVRQLVGGTGDRVAGPAVADEGDVAQVAAAGSKAIADAGLGPAAPCARTFFFSHSRIGRVGQTGALASKFGQQNDRDRWTYLSRNSIART